MRRCKIHNVEGDDRIRLHRHRCCDHVPIIDIDRFEDGPFGELERDCRVRERSVHNSRNPLHSFDCIAIE